MFDETLNEVELSTKQPMNSVVTIFLGSHWNTEYEKKLKSYWKVSTNPRHECQSNCIFCSHTQTVFQRNMLIWMKSSVCAFTKVKICPISKKSVSMSRHFLFTKLHVKTILFQTIQWSIRTQFSFIRPIDKPLSGATTLGQSRPGSDRNKGVVRIFQSSRISWVSRSNCLVFWTTHSLREPYPSAEKQLVYSAVPNDRAIIVLLSFNILRTLYVWHTKIHRKLKYK